MIDGFIATVAATDVLIAALTDDIELPGRTNAAVAWSKAF
jgi:hypothetical protein